MNSGLDVAALSLENSEGLSLMSVFVLDLLCGCLESMRSWACLDANKEKTVS